MVSMLFLRNRRSHVSNDGRSQYKIPKTVGSYPTGVDRKKFFLYHGSCLRRKHQQDRMLHSLARNNGSLDVGKGIGPKGT